MQTVALLLAAWAGLAAASPVHTSRAPQKAPGYSETSPGGLLTGAAKNGIKDWGPSSSLRPPSGGPNAPMREMPLGAGWPELNSPKKGGKGSESKGLGDPLGPKKKPDRIYPSPSKGDVFTHPSQLAADNAEPNQKTRARLTVLGRGKGRAVSALALGALSPYLKDVVETMKEWDNPIGFTVKEFDDAMARIQEAIGGKKVPEIPGNELQLWFICLFKEDHPEHPNRVDEACARRRNQNPEAEQEEEMQQHGLDELNKMLAACASAELAPPTDDGFRDKLLQRCAAFVDEVEDKEDSIQRLANLRDHVRGMVAQGGRIRPHHVDEAVAYIKRVGLSGEDEEEARELAVAFLET